MKNSAIILASALVAGASSHVISKRDGPVCPTWFRFYISITGPNGAIPSVGYTASMETDVDDEVLDITTCYLGKYGKGCKWQKSPTIVNDLDDVLSISHYNYKFFTGPDLSGKDLGFTHNDCDTLSCTLSCKNVELPYPDGAQLFTICSCDSPGTPSKTKALPSDDYAGMEAADAAKNCNSKTENESDGCQYESDSNPGA